MTTKLSYCATEVRRHDPDRFMTTLFAPADRREGLYALYAFNLEIAKTRETITEPMIGRIRLQWWRETIDDLYRGRVREHGIARPLAELVTRAGISRRHLDRLIDAREFDLEDSPPASLAALESYAEGTSSVLVAAALECLGAGGEAADHVARELGVAWALIGLIRAVPFHAQRRRLYLPRDLMATAGVDANALFERGPVPGLDRVIRPVLDRARERLDAARHRRKDVPRAALPAFLPATIADIYLVELRRADCDPFALDPFRKHALKPLRLMTSALLGRY